VKIELSHLSCKFKFGQHLSEERFEMILSHLEQRGTTIDMQTIEIMTRIKIQYSEALNAES